MDELMKSKLRKAKTFNKIVKLAFSDIYAKYMKEIVFQGPLVEKHCDLTLFFFLKIKQALK